MLLHGGEHASSIHFAGNLGPLTWVRLQQPREPRYPFLPLCAVFVCVQTMFEIFKQQCLSSTAVFEIFVVRTDVDACDCTRGHRKRVCTGQCCVRLFCPTRHHLSCPAPYACRDVCGPFAFTPLFCFAELLLMPSTQWHDHQHLAVHLST